MEAGCVAELAGGEVGRAAGVGHRDQAIDHLDVQAGCHARRRGRCCGRRGTPTRWHRLRQERGSVDADLAAGNLDADRLMVALAQSAGLGAQDATLQFEQDAIGVTTPPVSSCSGALTWAAA